MKRYLHEPIRKDLQKKMVILAGPGQVGKTLLAKELTAEFKAPQCLNFDSVADVKTINNQSWPLQSDLLILDEIHKKPQWKKYMSIFSAMQPRLQKSAFTWNNAGNP